MPKVILNKDFDYFPSKEARVCKVLRASPKPQTVTQEAADRIVAAGIGEVVEDKASKK